MKRLRDAVREGAPAPEDALRRLDRIAEAVPDLADICASSDEALTILALACRRAPYLGTLLARDAGRLARVSSDPHLHREKPAEVMRDQLGASLSDCPGDDPTELLTRLRRYRNDEMVRLGARELDLGNPADVGRELAHLADVSLDAAIDFHRAALDARYGPAIYTDADGNERRCELVVIGMGKLGGQELNFSSDIDIIYIYSSDDGAAGDLSLHEYFAKLCQRVNAALADITERDFVFRVDMRLRPEGSRGPLANSLPSAERYYETFGRPWERQAWLKARPCAGSMELGVEVMRTLRAFVYPRVTSPNVIAEVADLNRRIKSELDRKGIDSGFDLKNGVGGIREVEFFVQALQLVHGARQHRVRSKTTLVALDQLLFTGIITESEHRALTEAYRFLRRAEHLLQLESGRQTQRLPSDPDALEVFARRFGYDNQAAFSAELTAHTTEVARLFSTLGDPDDQVPGDITTLLGGRLTREREVQILAARGFRNPERAQHNLEIARRKPLSPFGEHASGAARRVAPELFAEICNCPDPDQALHYTAELISRRGAWSPLWTLFSDNPMLMRLIASLFGTSEFLAKVFVGHPELIDRLLQAGSAQPTLAPESMAAELQGGSADDGDEETQWNRLAEMKQGQVLRIGMADIGGVLDSIQVCEELSAVAQVCLARAFSMVSDSMRERHGVPRHEDGTEATLAVLALGKMGGRELGYASDLDLIFVYSGAGSSDGERPLENVVYMTRLAQRLMNGLHTRHRDGRLYEIDARLRPSGSKGLLVSTLAAWERYHRTSARQWERQALTKLRAVAGDAELGARVEADAIEFVYGAPSGPEGRPSATEIGAGVTAMRDRIERELAQASQGRDLKTGKGGLVDVEFAAQYLQLAHGHDHAQLRTPSTLAALSAAADVGLIDSDDARLLEQGYRFLRKLEHRLRIVHDSSVHRLPTDPVQLDLLGRRAGYSDGEALLRDYSRWTSDVRAAYTRIVAAAR